MDIVLEILDRFAYDHIYAFVLPARSAPYGFSQATATNATGNWPPFSTWTYKPATSFFSIEPSQAAYMSAWPRDNIYRQAISLYATTW